jgi:hypothetical protein
VVQDLGQTALRGEVDPLVFCEVGHAYPRGLGGQIGVARSRDHELLDADLAGGAVPVGGRRSDREVGVARLHGRDEVVGVAELDELDA